MTASYQQDLLVALLPQWHALLQEWSSSGRLTSAAQEALLLNGKPQALTDLLTQWSSGDFRNIPEIVLLSSGDISGAMGAYAISTGKIYLNQAWLLTATQDQVNVVLTEELGHHLDGLLNAIDTPGDEGENFSRKLFGTTTRSRPREQLGHSDTGTIIEKKIQAEFCTPLQDTTPASLTSLTLSNTSVDITSGDATVTVTATFSDDLSGFDPNEYVQLSWSSPAFGQNSRRQGLYADLIAQPGGTLSGTTYTGTVTIPRYSVLGEWTLDYALVRDRADNHISYDATNINPTTQGNITVTANCFVPVPIINPVSNAQPESPQGTSTPVIKLDPLISPSPSNTDNSPISSPVLGAEIQDSVMSFQLDSPLTVKGLDVNQAIVGTPQADKITGTNESEAISGGPDKDELIGNKGSDVFIFETPNEFGKTNADIVSDFSRRERDKIGVAQDVFQGITEVTFQAVNGKSGRRRASASSNAFIYDRPKGFLYFNQNGEEKGFGEGGVFAILSGAPKITVSDIAIL